MFQKESRLTSLECCRYTSLLGTPAVQANHKTFQQVFIFYVPTLHQLYVSGIGILLCIMTDHLGRASQKAVLANFKA
jgi:hypothetical protein